MHKVYSDSYGNIYVAQAVGGLDVYNQSSDTFYALTSDTSDLNFLSSNLLPSAFLQDTDKNVWIGYPGKGLNKYNPLTGKVERILPDYKDESSLTGVHISSIYQDTLNDSAHVWVSTLDRGLFKIDLKTNRVLRFEWRDIRYPSTLFKFLDEKVESGNVEVEISEPADSVSIKREFKLSEHKEFIVVSTGEAFQNNRFDYGYIKKSGRIIWDFDQHSSFYAGGANKNRILIDVIRLAPGNYSVNYRSDDSHSHENWNEKAPDHPRYWGIKLIPINKKEADRIKNVLAEIKPGNSFPAQSITDIASSPVGDMYFSTWGAGIVSISKSGIVESVTKDMDDENSFLHELGVINDRHLWAINRQNEVLVIDLRNKSKIDLKRKLQISPGEHKVSVDLYENLWVAVAGEGLCKISFKNDKPSIVHFKHDPNDNSSISSNLIGHLYSDRYGNTWIGTEKSGLNRINPGKINFNIAFHILDRNDNGEYPAITAVAHGPDNNLIIGTNGAGIFQFNTQDYSTRRIPLTNSIKNIRSIMCDGDFLWIGTIENGFFIVDYPTGSIRKDLFKDLQQELSKETIYCFLKDSHNYFWIGSRTKGIFKLDPVEGKYENYSADISDAYSLPANSVWAIYEDSQNNLWVGTAVGGLSKYNYQANKFTNYLYDESDPSSLNNTSVTCFAEDDKGNFWIGTYSGGINLMDRATGKFSHITTDDGLPNNSIDGMLIDDAGRIWVSTKGLARYNPNTGEVKKYTKINGLQSEDFYRGAYLKVDGIMYFGGALGLNYFDPQKLGDLSIAPNILFSEFRKYNSPVRFEKLLNKLDEIRLSYFENHFSFEFIALDYSNAHNTQYAYKLEGFDDDWIFSGTRRFASYTNLDPGRYTFRVKAASGEGIWNEQGRSIAIIVSPPFWLTWWFIAIIVSLLISILWLLHKWQIRTNIEKTLAHERIRIQERERVREELARDFHDELGHKLTRITVFVRRLKKQLNGAAEKITQDLSSVSEISYDLRVGAKDLIWTLKPDEDTLYDLAIRLKDFGDELFRGTEIKFIEKGISENLKKYSLPMDWKRHLVLIFKEAMNNSLKYSACNSVELDISINANELKISVTDDGVGFDTSSETSGYGIDNIKVRANKINGNVEIFSNVGKGTKTVFVSTLRPMNNEKESMR